MKRQKTCVPNPGSFWFTEEDCDIDEFADLCSRTCTASEFKFAAKVEQNVPIYDCAKIKAAIEDTPKGARHEIMAEWINILKAGSGVVVLQGAFSDTRPIDEASDIFKAIIDDVRLKGGGADHFATAGANDRIWNAQEKFCVRAPGVFAKYFANGFINAISEAWLGPGYEMTSQVNNIRPGGKAQEPHRDYHLGFQAIEQVRQYPSHVHQHLSPMLTLQGAVAHVDIPLESGPTKLLPFSQLYARGYLAWKLPAFKEYFEKNFVHLPLRKGDLVFFNPALFHAGGSNTTSGEESIDRLVNLLQVSSPYGRAMEAINHLKMCKALYPELLRMQEVLSPAEVNCAVAACGAGYAFPTNLDTDPPLYGNSPPTQQDIFRKALKERWTAEAFGAELDRRAAKQTPQSD